MDFGRIPVNGICSPAYGSWTMSAAAHKGSEAGSLSLVVRSSPASEPGGNTGAFACCSRFERTCIDGC